MKKRLLKIVSLFISASVLLLNVKLNAEPTRARKARQKMEIILQKYEAGEEVNYKYLAEQLCIRFTPPQLPNKKLTFDTPFGVVGLEIRSTGSILIATGVRKYKEIAETLDGILTKNGRKRLAKIILEYLETGPDANYEKKSFDKYEFKKHEDFFDLKNEKGKFYFKNESDSTDVEQLSQQMEHLKIDKNSDTESNKSDNEEDSSAQKQSQKSLSPSEKAKKAARALCAILMVAEPHYRRSFDGGKHERALIRDIKCTGITFAEAFKKFVPSKTGGGSLAFKYSGGEDESKKKRRTKNKNLEKELLESEYYSDDEDSTYSLELLSI